MELLTLFITIVVIIIVYLIYMSWNFRIFTKQGIPNNSTPIPMFGTILPLFSKGVVELYNGSLAKHGKTFGDFDGRQPVLSTVDAEIIKTVFIKEHNAFPNRRVFESGVDINDNMLTNISDYAHWKFVRSLMSPTFSTGKLRGMIKQINKCAKQMKEHLIQNSTDNKSVEMKEFTGSFTMDVIASTAFGVDLNTKDDYNNPFVVNAKKAFMFTIFNPLFIVAIFFPFLKPVIKLFSPSLIPRDTMQFFAEVTRKTMEARKDDKSRSDFLSLMMSAHKEDNDETDLKEHEIQAETPKRALTEVELISQSVLFFIAGYETTATTISFLAYNLACNPEKQDLLLEEIDRVIDDQDDVTDKDFNEMPYLEMCINETLRLYPPALFIERQAVRDVEVKGIKISNGTLVRVPVYHLQRHDEFYPEPLKFIPERFSSEAKSARDPLLFLPFGLGPRQCIAIRLAMLEIKIATTQVLRTHKFTKAPETEIPVKLDNLGLLKAVNGIWLRLEQRK